MAVSVSDVHCELSIITSLQSAGPLLVDGVSSLTCMSLCFERIFVGLHVVFAGGATVCEECLVAQVFSH